MPQGRFLPFMVERAARFPGFRVEMGARVSALLRDPTAGRPRDRRRVHPRRGAAPVAARTWSSARTGATRRCGTLSTITATELGAHLDICWYEVPRRDGDPPLSGLGLIAEPGATLAVLGQAASWQLGYTIPAGTFPALRAGGIGPVVGALRRRLPWLGDRLDGLTEVNQLTLLPVRITPSDRWSEPGLLLIGDAAHVISPVGGNGVNFAVLDAVEAANRLVGPLLADRSTRGGGRGDGRGRGRPPPAGRPRPAAAEADRARRGAAAAHRAIRGPRSSCACSPPCPGSPGGRRAAVSGRCRPAARRPDPAPGGRPALTAAHNAVGCTARAAIPAVAGPRRSAPPG